jgi:hypothetical protein
LTTIGEKEYNSSELDTKDMTENIIPLEVRVQVKEGMVPQLLEKIKQEGVFLPRRDHRPHLGVFSVLNIANYPTEISLKACQYSLGRYKGKVMFAEKREEAFAVRKQFADFLDLEETSDNQV